MPAFLVIKAERLDRPHEVSAMWCGPFGSHGDKLRENARSRFIRARITSA